MSEKNIRARKVGTKATNGGISNFKNKGTFYINLPLNASIREA